MPPRKTHVQYAPHVAIYNQDDVPRDDVVASMIAKIDFLFAQMVKLLLAKHHCYQNAKTNQVKDFLIHSPDINIELNLLTMEDMDFD